MTDLKYAAEVVMGDHDEVKADSILDKRTFGECRTDSELIKECLVAFLLEQGFEEENLPPEEVRNQILNTFVATVAVRSLLPPETPMRRVITMWDKVMLNYVAARVAHNPACLAVNHATNEESQEATPRIIVPN